LIVHLTEIYHASVWSRSLSRREVITHLRGIFMRVFAPPEAPHSIPGDYMAKVRFSHGEQRLMRWYNTTKQIKWTETRKKGGEVDRHADAA